MSKKDFQAIARAIYATREMIYRDPSHDVVRDDLLAELTVRLSRLFAERNPRFDATRFREACETGKCGWLAE